MLKKIIIRNFTSFKNETVIDFFRTNYKFLENNVSDGGILKGIAFYGANASGKSNALLAIRILIDLLFGEVDNYTFFFMKCLLSEEPDFSLEYFFTIDNEEIRYLVEYNVEKVMFCEKLYLEGELLLERLGSTAKSYITERKVYEDLKNEILFLRTIYFNTGFSNNDILRKWFDYMRNSVYVNPFKKLVISYGQHSMSINKYIKDKGVGKINQFFKAFNFEYTVDYYKEKEKDTAKLADMGNEFLIFFKRKGINIPIPYYLESLGTQNLLYILPSFLFVAQNGGMLLIDEFSSGFHNELERLLLKYFFKNAKNSQLFFVSHSTNLLSNSILRPDQIYSVEFNGEQGSQVKRFSDEQPRLAQNLEKMYLSGVFGGLPNYRDEYENK